MQILKKNNIKYSIFIKNNFIYGEGITELNDDTDSLQNLIIVKNKGTYIKPHYPKNRLKNNFQHNEVMFVISGKLLIKLFDNEKKFLKQYEMVDNDIMIFLNGYHSVEFMEDSKIFEVKPGPYDKNLDSPERFDE